MENTKTCKLAEKLHNVICHDYDDANYIASHGYYGRCSLNTREYIYKGKSFSNNYNAWETAMKSDNYDRTNVVEDLDDITMVRKDNEASWKTYGNLVSGTQEDKALFTEIRSLDARIFHDEYEAHRLANLKSKASHRKSREIFEELEVLLEELKALKEKHIKRSSSTKLVRDFCFTTHNKKLSTIINSFKNTGSYSYRCSWKREEFLNCL